MVGRYEFSNSKIFLLYLILKQGVLNYKSKGFEAHESPQARKEKDYLELGI